MNIGDCCVLLIDVLIWSISYFHIANRRIRTSRDKILGIVNVSVFHFLFEVSMVPLK